MDHNPGRTQSGTVRHDLSTMLHAPLLRAFHLQAQVGLVVVEPFMAVGPRIGSLGGAAEAIDI